MKITTLVSDFSRVLIDSTDPGIPSLNDLYGQIKDSGDHFEKYYVINKELLAYLDTIKNDYDLYIFTSGMLLHTAPVVKESFGKLFRAVITTKEIKGHKAEKETYRRLARHLKAKSGEIVFIDDREENIAAAREAGMLVVHHTENSATIEQLKKLLTLEE